MITVSLFCAKVWNIFLEIYNEKLHTFSYFKYTDLHA